MTLAHGLGSVPSLVRVGVICTGAENGYLVNDIIWDLNVYFAEGGNGTYGYTTSANATNIYISTGARIDHLNKSQALFNLDLTKWKYIVRAWA